MSGSLRASSNDARGRQAELIAAWFLRLKGFTIEAVRYRTPVGELDLVARRGDLLVFVEVKQRRLEADARGALTPRQQARITRAAAAYLQQRPDLAGAACRFDVIAVDRWGLPHQVQDAWRPES